MTSAAAPPSDSAPCLRVPAWGSMPNLVHGFFGRAGGMSGGPFTSLNVSDRVGDDATAVAGNWQRVGATLSGLPFARMSQVHGTQILRVESAPNPIAEGDGMITDGAGFALAVLTADCVPMLAVAPAARAVMGLHGGWRGTLAGVAASGMREAQTWLGIDAADWQVALGPSIDGCCYEVEAEIGEQFTDRWGAMPDAWQRQGSHGQLDLRAASRHILIQAGVPEGQIVKVGPCTSCAGAEYFSHRQSGGRAGRQVSAIGWTA